MLLLAKKTGQIFLKGNLAIYQKLYKSSYPPITDSLLTIITEGIISNMGNDFCTRMFIIAHVYRTAKALREKKSKCPIEA